MTDRAKQLLLNDLSRLSSDEDVQIQILEQSIKNGWKGVFPLKEESAAKNTTRSPISQLSIQDVIETGETLERLFPSEKESEKNAEFRFF